MAGAGSPAARVRSGPRCGAALENVPLVSAGRPVLSRCRRELALVGAVIASAMLNGCIVYAPATAPGERASSSVPGEPAGPTSIAEAIELCRRVQAAEEIPVECEFRYFEGAPVVTMAFHDVRTFEEHFEPMTRFVGAPFCAAANRASRRAYVSVVVGQQMRVYVCEVGRWSDWQSLDDPAPRSGDELSF